MMRHIILHKYKNCFYPQIEKGSARCSESFSWAARPTKRQLGFRQGQFGKSERIALPSQIKKNTSTSGSRFCNHVIIPWLQLPHTARKSRNFISFHPLLCSQFFRLSIVETNTSISIHFAFDNLTFVPVLFGRTSTSSTTRRIS